MKITTNQIFHQNTDKQIGLITTYLDANNFNTIEKKQIFRHLKAMLQILKYKFCEIDIETKSKTTLPAYLVLIPKNYKGFQMDCKELKINYDSLKYVIIHDVNKITFSERIEIEFDGNKVNLYLHDIVDKPYNYFSSTNFLGKMGIHTAANKHWWELEV